MSRPRPPFSLRLTVALAVAACAPGCGASEHGRTNVLLLSLDTLRADHLGCYGYDRPTSPAIDRLAAEGVLFESVMAPSPWTLPSHASLLTGLYPSQHGLSSNLLALPERVRTSAEAFRAAGYRTAAFVNSHLLTEKHRLDRGFGEFTYVREEVTAHTPSEVGLQARLWLARNADAPFFLFVHNYDVHSDYASLPQYEEPFLRSPGPPHATGSGLDGSTRQLIELRSGGAAIDPADMPGLVDRYDAGIRQADDEIAAMLSFLDEHDLAQSTVVVLTSDHGEEFLEHGSVLHGRTQYREVLHVPLILRGPGIPAGARVAAPASLIDVFPTIAGLAGLPLPSSTGVDLSPTWLGGELEPRVLFAEADWKNEEHDVRRAVRDGRFKLHLDLSTGESRLFDLEEDPGETRDVTARHPEVAERLRGELERFLEERVEGDPIPEPTSEELEFLRDLGYGGSESSASTE